MREGSTMSADHSWRKLLYMYLRAQNKLEVEYTNASLEEVVSDASYLDKQVKRLRALKEYRYESPYHKICSETNAKINHVVEQQGQLNVYVELKRHHIYRTGQKERRIEREKVTFAPAAETKAGLQGRAMRSMDQRWRLIRVEPDESERTNRERELFEPEHQEQVYQGQQGPASSGPLLHEQIFSPQGAVQRSFRYQREKAVKYADRWWSEGNPQYLEFDVNCTNYVSQCLFAGGAPMNYTGKRETGWWYHGKSKNRELWSYSWAVSNSLQSFLLQSKSGLKGVRKEDPRQLLPGDLIFYDWDGDSRFQHSTIVTDIGKDGYPLVNANTVSSYHRYWDYRDSYAWTDNTKYLFVHILDS